MAHCTMMARMDIEDTTVTSSTACEWLGIDRSTLTRWVQAGHLVPVFKYPGKNGAYLFERAEVDRVKRDRAAGVR
jgi:excisionase family DNA binding protein